MKKFSAAFLSAATLVALTTACSSSEILEEGPALQTGAISFGTTNIANASRAAVTGTLSNDNFSTFFVFGSYNTSALGTVTIFSGDQVTKQANGDWTYSDTRYWLPEATYNFYAYSCGNSGENSSTNATPVLDGKLRLENFKMHGTHDLIYAEATGISGADNSQNPQKVNMEFRHILTRVKFSFHGNVPGNDYKMRISDVKLENLLNEATYDGEFWDKYNKKDGELAISFSGTDNLVPVTGTDNLECIPVFVIPNQRYIENYNDNNYVDLIFTMVIERDVVKDGVTTTEPVLTRTVKAQWEPNWAQGKSLNNVINIKFNEATGLKPIEFSASIVKPTDKDDTWIDEEGGLSNITFNPITEVGN